MGISDRLTPEQRRRERRIDVLRSSATQNCSDCEGRCRLCPADVLTELLAEIDALTRERDALRSKLTEWSIDTAWTPSELAQEVARLRKQPDIAAMFQLQEQVARLTRERDEAREQQARDEGRRYPDKTSCLPDV